MFKQVAVIITFMYVWVRRPVNFTPKKEKQTKVKLIEVGNFFVIFPKDFKPRKKTDIAVKKLGTILRRLKEKIEGFWPHPKANFSDVGLFDKRKIPVFYLKLTNFEEKIKEDLKTVEGGFVGVSLNADGEVNIYAFDKEKEEFIIYKIGQKGIEVYDKDKIPKDYIYLKLLQAVS